MRFRDFLEPARLGRVPPTVSFRPTPKVRRAKERALDRLSDREAHVTAADLDEIEGRLRRAAATNDWSLVSPRDWRYAPLCLWRNHSPYLAEDIRFLSSFLAWLVGAKSRRATRALIRIYLERFDPSLPGFTDVATKIQASVGNWTWEWASRQLTYRLFVPAVGPGELASAALTSQRPPLEVLAGAGLGGPLAASRFAAESFRRATVAIERQLEKTPAVAAVDLLTAWAIREDRLLYPSLSGRLADSLLLPWTKKAVPDDVQRRIQDFLLARYGDPRLLAKEWNTVSDVAKSVMLSWLAKASLNQFLDVVGSTAVAHQWEYRRAFWTSYYEAGHIAESWVVFARNPAANARRIADQTDDPSMRSFGEFKRSTGDGDHAVLLLRIGDLTIADWSHNGRCRIWIGAVGGAPELYLHGDRGYTKYGLTEGSDLERTHWPQGQWQAEVARFISRHTGISMYEREYMPKRKR